MPKKRFGAEQIVMLLRQIEVSMAQGKPTPVACRDAGISQQNYATSCSTERSPQRRPRLPATAIIRGPLYSTDLKFTQNEERFHARQGAFSRNYDGERAVSQPFTQGPTRPCSP